ncbi:MAG: DNA translocase FtsK [Lachnospiraceae bacterium]|nr:DNA translocase FtsK [Lachnospiraceae bacterium]MBQ7360856.1 DNA translocase FtsK [Lachnospiraceae bacterium]
MPSNNRKRTTTSRNGSNRNRTSRTSQNHRRQSRGYTPEESAIFKEVGLIVLFALVVILFLCNFGVIGTLGDSISAVMFGLFGVTAYIAPVAILVATLFWRANEGNNAAIIKICAGVILFLMVGVIFEFVGGTYQSLKAYDIKEIYLYSSENRSGGGVFAGSLAYGMYSLLDIVGSILVVIVLSIVGVVLLTEHSFVSDMKMGKEKVMAMSKEDALRRREQLEIKKERQEQLRLEREESRRLREEQKEAEKQLRLEQKETEKILRMEKKVTGVSLDTSLKDFSQEEHSNQRDDMHEITLHDKSPLEAMAEFESTMPQNITEFTQESMYLEPVLEEVVPEVGAYEEPLFSEPVIPQPKEVETKVRDRRPVAKLAKEEPSQEESISAKQTDGPAIPKKYVFPPLSMLKKSGGSGAAEGDTRATAQRLQSTLKNFGVNVTITDITQGPTITRYELQLEPGVKVNKILSLADDIKLNLAATDIRIEAPIPGKAAVGIEVPNKESSPVYLRDLLETKEFQQHKSNIAFGVGKDIAGKATVVDIAKMPHMLIAGATGSGKSVCINTLIMSILYKAHPDDVKLIMIDPKVVELQVYNGIPHLLNPVITDVKKAPNALQGSVAEMLDRYSKFADMNVRNIEGYNQVIESMKANGEDNVPPKMPQIVIIVDEFADLMMSGDKNKVEEAICRLAQLARAAGIHLILATQRPSVDVITGLIKANMPSRIAFSVSSGVDSRTILDMNGAEKLLGKGDMLFLPQDYSKPARLQGAFVSDEEVANVVDFIKNQVLGNVYSDDFAEKMKSCESDVNDNDNDSSDSREEVVDPIFADAGRFVIEKGKASASMLQTYFRIGFVRAKRIIFQLTEYGVISEEFDKKPCKILITMEQFEQLLDQISNEQ